MFHILYIPCYSKNPCADPVGEGQGARTPLEKSPKYRVSKHFGPDSLKIHKATRPACNDTQAKRHLNGVRWRAIDAAYSGI